MGASTKVILEQTVAWYDFERNYRHFDWNAWMLKYRFISVVFGAIYLALLFFGRRYMRNRDPYVLRAPLALWNLLMSAFSIACVVRVGPYFIKRAFSIPFADQMCENEYHENPAIMFWLDFFVLSKPVEFIDTLFIVLRKQHLHFLHYYHHVTVVILCYYSLGVAPIPPNAIYYVAMNAFVHSLMYTYYLLRAIRITVPRIAQMSITISQILQMFVGCIINVAPFLYRRDGSHCDAAYESIYLGGAIYFSYLLLFMEFFANTYLFKKKPSAHEKLRSD